MSTQPIIPEEARTPPSGSRQRPERPRRRRRDVGQILARLLCLVLALFALVPVALAAGLRSPAVRAWAAEKVQGVARSHQVNASFQAGVSFIPLAVFVTELRVEATDGGSPALQAKHVAVRPKLFALIAGKLAIDQIDIDTPRARIVMKDGELQNLGIKLPEKKKDEPSGPFHAPFRGISMTDGAFDVSIDDVAMKVDGVDVDVAAQGDARAGSSFETSLWVGSATVDRKRKTATGDDALDEDVLCRLDGRVRIEPDTITVHRLTANGSVDLEGSSGTRPGCKLLETDRRRVDVALNNLRVRLPKGDDLPQVSGRIRARAPIAFADRFVEMPSNDGWVGTDLELRFVEGMRLPEIDGKIEGADIRILKYHLAKTLEGEIRTRADVIESRSLKVVIGDAMVTLGDVKVEPLVKGIPIRASVDIKDLNFTSLMRDLGVHPHSHVQWDVREGKVPVFGGTIVPVKLDGEFTAKSENFAVYDRPADGPNKTRMIGVASANFTTHVSVRSDSLQFQRIRLNTPKSQLDNVLVSIGFNEVLKVEAPAARIDLSELSPLGSVPIAGQADATVNVFGEFGDPKLEADTTIQAFSIADIPFGNVTAAHVKFQDMAVQVSSVKATKGKSHYEMPQGTVDFGGKANMALDATVTSPSFDFRDFLALWHMEDDPRFLEMEGSLSTRSNVHIALGGPQDKCGGGYIDVDAHARVKDVVVFGERFDDGELDLDYEWSDRLAGMYGANIDVHSFSLRKLRRGDQGGSLLGSATVDHGKLSGNVVIQGIPLSRVQTLGKLGQRLEATASGFARMTGTIDEYALEGDLDVSPALVRGTRFGASRLHFRVNERMNEAVSQKAKIIGKTSCGGPIAEAFNKDAYLKSNKVSHGEMRATGELFAGQVRIDELVMTREDDPAFRASLDLNKFDLGAASRLVTEPDQDGETEGLGLEGVLSGSLSLDRLRKSDYSHAKIEFSPRELTVSQGGQSLALKTKGSKLTVESDAVNVPPLAFELKSKAGFAGGVTVAGSVSKLTKSVDLDLRAELDPIDLGVLTASVPRIQRAQGKLTGGVRVTGRAMAPTIDGQVKIRGGDFSVQGLPSAITNVDIDVSADSSEIRIDRGNARFSGGTVALSGRVPLRGLALGAGEIAATARGIRFAPDDGMNLTADAELALTFAPSDPETGRGKLPHVSGDVTITSFDYTRPMALTGSLGDLKTKRAVVDTYDPNQDAVTFDVSVRSRNPLRIHNNMVEAQLVIDSDALQVTGTNQRMGLRGELKSMPGGRFHFRTSDFEVRQAILRFDDPTRIAPTIDVVAVTEYRRLGDSANVSTGGGRQAGLWRITLHAYGEADNLHLDMTSDPPLSQEDIILLLTIGMTRAELDQLQAGALGAGAALEALAAASGADKVVKKAVPVIDDFRFGSAYSARSGRTEPQVTLGKRITEDVRATVTTSLGEDRELRSNLEWRLTRGFSLQGSYDNINDVASSTIGNIGADVRWRVEFR